MVVPNRSTNPVVACLVCQVRANLVKVGLDEVHNGQRGPGHRPPATPYPHKRDDAVIVHGDGKVAVASLKLPHGV